MTILGGYLKLQWDVGALQRDQIAHRLKVEKTTEECRARIEALPKALEVEMAMLAAKPELARSQAHELQVKMAQDYVSREMLAGLEDRFDKAIDRLATRMERAIEGIKVERQG